MIISTVPIKVLLGAKKSYKNILEPCQFNISLEKFKNGVIFLVSLILPTLGLLEQPKILGGHNIPPY